MWKSVLLSSSVLQSSWALSCYECEVVLDHLGNMVGSGYASCFDDPSQGKSVDCNETTRCKTEMSVEWYFMGEQLVHMKRGCAPKGYGKIILIGKFLCGSTLTEIVEKSKKYPYKR